MGTELTLEVLGPVTQRSVLDALEAVLGDEAKYVIKNLALSDLKAYMILCDDVCTVKGQLLISRGQEVGPLMMERLKNFSDHNRIKEPIRVFIPMEIAEDRYV